MENQQPDDRVNLGQICWRAALAPLSSKNTIAELDS